MFRWQSSPTCSVYPGSQFSALSLHEAIKPATLHQVPWPPPGLPNLDNDPRERRYKGKGEKGTGEAEKEEEEDEQLSEKSSYTPKIQLRASPTNTRKGDDFAIWEVVITLVTPNKDGLWTLSFRNFPKKFFLSPEDLEIRFSVCTLSPFPELIPE
jgi:hypothetical protein